MQSVTVLVWLEHSSTQHPQSDHMESQYVAQEVADVDDGIHKNVSPFPTRVILRITGHGDVLIAVSN